MAPPLYDDSKYRCCCFHVEMPRGRGIKPEISNHLRYTMLFLYDKGLNAVKATEEINNVYGHPEEKILSILKAAYFIAIIGAALNLIGALGYFLQRQWAQGGGAIFSALLYILVLVAYHKRNPSFYLPFLVLKAIALVLYFLSILFLLVVFFVMPDFYADRVRNEWISSWPPGQTYNEGDFKLYFRLWTGFLILMTAVITGVESMFWYIIHKAYKYMKETE